MFNTRIGDAEAAQEETVALGARRATAPNQPSPGNAAGVVGGSSNLVTAPPEPTGVRLPAGVYPDQIGIDADGNYWHPFYLGMDTPDDAGAYVTTGYATRDYGN